MTQVDLHIHFEEVTYESQMIKNVTVVPTVGARIRTRYGYRKVTDVVFDYTDDGDCDVIVTTIA